MKEYSRGMSEIPSDEQPEEETSNDFIIEDFEVRKGENPWTSQEQLEAQRELEEYELQRTMTELEWENKSDLHKNRISYVSWDKNGPVLTIMEDGMGLDEKIIPSKTELNELIVESFGFQDIKDSDDYGINWLIQKTMKNTYKEKLWVMSGKLIFHESYKHYDLYYNRVYRFAIKCHALREYDDMGFRREGAKYSIENIESKVM